MGYALLPRYRFHLFFSNVGYQKKEIFLKPVVKCVISLLSFEFFSFWSIFFPLILSKIACCHLEGNILKLVEEIILGVHTPVLWLKDFCHNVKDSHHVNTCKACSVLE